MMGIREESFLLSRNLRNTAVEHLNARVEEGPVRDNPEIQEVNDDLNNQALMPSLNQLLTQLLPLAQPTQIVSAGVQLTRKRAPKRCTICGLENHPQCKRPSGGACNTPPDQFVPYKKSRGNRSN